MCDEGQSPRYHRSAQAAAEILNLHLDPSKPKAELFGKNLYAYMPKAEIFGLIQFCIFRAMDAAEDDLRCRFTPSEN